VVRLLFNDGLFAFRGRLSRWLVSLSRRVEPVTIKPIGGCPECGATGAAAMHVHWHGTVRNLALRMEGNTVIFPPGVYEP